MSDYQKVCICIGAFAVMIMLILRWPILGVICLSLGLGLIPWAFYLDNRPNRMMVGHTSDSMMEQVRIQEAHSRKMREEFAKHPGVKFHK